MWGGEHVVLVAGRDTDEAAVLGGEQEVAFAEARDKCPVHLAGGWVRVVDRGSPLGHGNGVGAGEEQAEAFGALGQSA
jgi:hypothetical protein